MPQIKGIGSIIVAMAAKAAFLINAHSRAAISNKLGIFGPQYCGASDFVSRGLFYFCACEVNGTMSSPIGQSQLSADKTHGFPVDLCAAGNLPNKDLRADKGGVPSFHLLIPVVRDARIVAKHFIFLQGPDLVSWGLFLFGMLSHTMSAILRQMTGETIDYRGYQLLIRPRGDGLELTIRQGIVENVYRPTVAEPEKKEALFAEGRRIVDASLRDKQTS